MLNPGTHQGWNGSLYRQAQHPRRSQRTRSCHMLAGAIRVTSDIRVPQTLGVDPNQNNVKSCSLQNLDPGV
eukprot:scaffold269_cov125-Cylindrotheca_fusiformis.AAC.4